MRLFSEPRCPQCGASLPTKQLWDLAGFDRLGLLREKSGIICPQCGSQLKVIQVGVFLAFFLPCLGVGVLVALFPHALEAIGMDLKVLGILLEIPVFMFWIEYGPCFARVRKVESGEHIVYPLSKNLWKNDYWDR
jgi:hypothetical protein